MPGYFEETLLEGLAPALSSGSLEIVPAVEALVRALEAAFPFAGSKIGWGAIPGAVEAFCEEEDQPEAFALFFASHASRMPPGTTVLYVSDNALDIALSGSIEAFSQHLAKILSIPQHHYFMAADFSWCMVLTMEGDMSFGFAPSKEEPSPPVIE